MRTLGEDDYVYMPLSDIHKATGFVNHITCHWWAVHPERGLLLFPYKAKIRDIKRCSPQRNSNEAITKRLAPPFAEARYLESVLVPIDLNDYN